MEKEIKVVVQVSDDNHAGIIMEEIKETIKKRTVVWFVGKPEEPGMSVDNLYSISDKPIPPPEKDTKIMPLCWHQINNSMDIPREEKKKALEWIEQNLDKVLPNRRLEAAFTWRETPQKEKFWSEINDLI